MDDYIKRDEALEAIRRIERVVKLSSTTIDFAFKDINRTDVGPVIFCENCANFHERVVDEDIITNFEHCTKGIRFDDPHTFYCAYGMRKGEKPGGDA